MNTQRIKDRVKGRQLAEQVVELLEWDTLSNDTIQGIRDHLWPPKEKPPSLEVGSVKLNVLEATEMPFGKHAGQCFRDIPIEYLTWLCEQQEAFLKTLRSYLKHPDIWKNQ